MLKKPHEIHRHEQATDVAKTLVVPMPDKTVIVRMMGAQRCHAYVLTLELVRELAEQIVSEGLKMRADR